MRLEVAETGYIRDYFKRIRWLPGIFSMDLRIREEAIRQAINGHIQLPAATCIKMAMIRLAPICQELGAHMILQVHDEVIFECPEDKVAELIPHLVTMTDGFMPIDFPVKVQAGKNWGDMERVA